MYFTMNSSKYTETDTHIHTDIACQAHSHLITVVFEIKIRSVLLETKNSNRIFYCVNT